MSMEDILKIFAQEADELLTEMEDALLALEDNPDDKELINSLFRAMHTIKGAAGVFNLTYIVDFTHPIETEVDKIRNGELKVDSDLIALLLKCKDHTLSLVPFAVQGDTDIPNELKAQGITILKEFGNVELPEETPAPSDSPVTKNTVPEISIKKEENDSEARPSNAVQSMITMDLNEGKTEAIPAQDENETDKDQWMISLNFKPDTLRNGLDPLSFFRFLDQLGKITNIVTVTNFPEKFEDCDFESCYLSFHIVFKGNVTKAQIEDVFEFAMDDCELHIIPSKAKVSEYLEFLDKLDIDESKKIGELLLNIGAITQNELNKALQMQETINAEHPESVKHLGELLVDQKIADQPVIEEALKKQQQAISKAQSIRVDSNKLGQLINLVGELVTSSAAMKVVIEKHHLQEANEIVSGVEHLVEEIRDTALQLRMVQIGETFSRFRRVTRDVSKSLGKSIDLVISGGESELDKTVVEKIADPLTHLVRNALDHGIETPDIRKAAGKPETGTVTLNAFHDSGHIVIEVIDDGAGLDPDKIRTKAENLGVIAKGHTMSRQEIFRLIFEAGLSTKPQANNLSGRGVGMDVVRRNIESLRGNIELDSELGHGTKITINLPLTLAIIDGFMVGAGSEHYVIPLSMVEECVEVDSTQWHEDKQRNFINLRDEVMPFLRLREFFHCTQHEKTSRESLVVVRFGRYKAGFVVDQLYGEQQTVIKPLGSIFQNLKGVSGATILGTGKIALILDVQGLVQLASARTKEHLHSNTAIAELSSHMEG